MSANESTDTVFYSWQKDLPSRTNRGFIQDALERAIDAVLQTDYHLDFILDRDTQNTPGAPDIAQTILSKIDRASIVVADISIINAGATGRLGPNPNVLFELGYAVHVLSWEYVLPVFNLATGCVEDLPFDLRSRRPITYTMTVGQEPAPERRALTRTLQEAFQLITQVRGERVPNVQLVFQPAPARFGVRNDGTSGIEVVKFVLEIPKSAHGNVGWPFAHHPIQRVDEDTVDGVPIWRMTLVRSDAPVAYGEPDDWRLPPLIGPGETEIFRYPNFVFRDATATDTRITAKIYLSQGNPLIFRDTQGELSDPGGSFRVCR
jgi:hypothetical protein